MSAVKLDPARDLGLPMDPMSSQLATPSMGGISDISSFTAPSAPQTALQTSPVQQSQAVTMQPAAVSQMPVMSPVIPQDTATQSFDVDESKSSNILFILSVLLFCASLGVVVYFALKYFSVL